MTLFSNKGGDYRGGINNRSARLEVTGVSYA